MFAIEVTRHYQDHNNMHYLLLDWMMFVGYMHMLVLEVYNDLTILLKEYQLLGLRVV